MNSAFVKAMKSNRSLYGVTLGLLVAPAALGCSVQASEGEAGEVSTVLQATYGPLGSTEPEEVITTLSQLREMRTSGKYRLGADIDASSTKNNRFYPIGTPWAPFTGTLDGDGHTISNLHIEPSDFGAPYTGMWTGLIGRAQTALIKNVHLTNVDVEGDDMTGALVGYLTDSELTDCSVTGKVTAWSGANDVGLVVGNAGNSTIARSSAVGTVTGGGRRIGGFVGYVTESADVRKEISEIFTNVTLRSDRTSGAVRSGGLAGEVTGVFVHDINVVGSVQGRKRVGGIVGLVSAPTAGLQTVLQRTLFRGEVIDSNYTEDYAGNFGYFSSGAVLRCDTSYWDKSGDDGAPREHVTNQDITCSQGFYPGELIFPYETAEPYYYPFIAGDGPLSQQDIDNSNGVFEQCLVHSGTDGDWGFGYCIASRDWWHLNADDEHISLANIPDPSIQPLLAGLGSCTPESATDLGSLNDGSVTVPADACVMFSDYPSWAHSVELQIQGVSSPTKFRWVNCDNTQVEIANVGATQLAIPFDDSCITVVKFEGSSNNNIALDTWGNP